MLPNFRIHSFSWNFIRKKKLFLLSLQKWEGRKLIGLTLFSVRSNRYILENFARFANLIISSYLYRVPNQLGTIPSYSFPIGNIRPRHFCWEGIPWTTLRCRDHQCLFRASQPDGQMRSTSRKIHGLLHVVPWWCCPQGCQRSHCNHQDQENHSG